MYISFSYRTQRIAQEMHKKISVILQHNIDDLRIGRPTISGVKVSRDLKNANVFVTFIDKDSKKEIDTAIFLLRRASRFVRFLLAKTICLRVVPVLLFKYDNSLVEGSRIFNLITAIQEQKRDNQLVINSKLGE